MEDTNSTEKVKVLYVTALGESAHAFLQSHFSTLLDEGYDVALACSPDEKAQEILQKEPRLIFQPLPLLQGIGAFKDLKSLFAFFRILKKFDPDIVHAHMSKASFIAVLASFIYRTPVRIYHNHGMALFSATGASRTLLSIIEKTTCKLATDIVFCSDSTRDTAIKRNICSKSKSRVIGHGTISGISENHFIDRPNPEIRNLLIEQLGLPKSNYYALFVGRIVKHKGVAELMAAWELLPADIHNNWTLVFAGDNNNDELASQLKTLSESRTEVAYVGFQDNIKEYYQLAHLLILPSWHEGFPYSVLEAQAAGVPAVVTDVTGNADAVVDGLNGHLTPVHDINALAATLEAAMSDGATLSKMGDDAKMRVESYFTEKKVISNLAKFYSKTLLPRVRK